MTKPSTPKREVKAEHRACRTYNHAWDFTTVKRDGPFYVQGLRCMRCGAERSQKLDSYGMIKGNKYDYPEGYLLDGGGALSQEERAQLRIAEVKVNYAPGSVKMADTKLRPRKRK